MHINAFTIAMVLDEANVLWNLKLYDTELRNKNSNTSSPDAGHEAAANDREQTALLRKQMH